MDNYRLGILYGLGAYLLWGVLPIYWKLLQHVEAMEILASRFLWSAVFVFLLLLATGKLNIFMQETKAIFSTKKTACCMVLAAIMISFNWGIFIWAVEAGRIVETSMGYYISPLMNVLFGVVFLRERLAKLQIAAVSCAAVGIGVIIVHNGGLPWIALTLPLTFAFYGLLQKNYRCQTDDEYPVGNIVDFTFGCRLFVLPEFCGRQCIPKLRYEYAAAFWHGAGAVTATPMLLFTACARKLPLNIVGFLQYISPSISLMIGVLIYGEPFYRYYCYSIWLHLGGTGTVHLVAAKKIKNKLLQAG